MMKRINNYKAQKANSLLDKCYMHADEKIIKKHLSTAKKQLIWVMPMLLIL